jgi:hypothetical protein
LSDPNSKKGKLVEEQVVRIVKGFYLSEEISKIMPGKKDVVSVMIDGERKH